MNPSIPVPTVMEALDVMVALRARLDNTPADSVLRTRALLAEAELRGKLLAALPERVAIRPAA